jgi:twitching motility protein PilI
MANREALRELQARLAKRLQAAQTEGMSVSWLAVKAGGHNYLLPLGQSGEIVALSNLQPVPYTKAWFKGVVNIRGGLFGVVDLAGFIESHGGAAAVSAPLTAEASVVTLNALLEVNCALKVDSLAGLRGSDAFRSTAPAAADVPAYFGNCFIDSEGGSWQEINLRALTQFPAFLSIGA